MEANVTESQAIEFIRRHGIVLASAAGPVPTLAEAIVGEPVRGSWWAHPRGREIFGNFRSVEHSPEVLICRLVAGKITFVHRRMWPALVRSAAALGAERIASVRQEHTSSGRHVNRIVPFPDWVPGDVSEAAASLERDEALKLLGPAAQ